MSISSVVETCRHSSLAQAVSASLSTCFHCAEKVVSCVLSKCFYVGYDALSARVAKERTQQLITGSNARPLVCQNDKNVSVDTLYIPSSHPNRTGNVIVFAETTSYQDRLEQGLPSKYRYFLDSGMDVVLWNPTELQNRQYAQDLLSVLRALKRQHPDQRIVVKGHCATVEPAIATAADLAQELRDDSITLILDRGYADVEAFTRSFTVLTKLPLIHRVIQGQFSCDGMRKLQTFPGKIIFIAPEDPTADQLVYWAGKNLTYAMHELRQTNGFREDAFIKLGEGSDHWSSWNSDEYTQITAELSKVGLVASNYLGLTSRAFSARPPLNFFKRTCLPILTKACC